MSTSTHTLPETPANPASGRVPRSGAFRLVAGGGLAAGGAAAAAVFAHCIVPLL